MKVFKLLVHQKTSNFFGPLKDVLINQRDYPNLKVGDVIEIYSPEDEFSRLLLQIQTFSEEFGRTQTNDQTLKETLKEKPSIGVEQTIANTFRLRPYSDVIVNVVNANDVTLDSVELFFKDQYLARKFNGIRCQVFEMWSQGERVASGYVNDDTKIVYRSASSMVYLFIQMSSEMWEFDINGDLYFEKAVNGFLSDLFCKWKKFNCSHDVTIVLFSRTFYEANSIEEFPNDMRECLQKDSKGRFYEDYYRVAVQNERYDDWSPILILLNRLFNQYENEVIRHHENQHSTGVPKAFNSTSSQGNFLEVLNMSLNVFDKHFLDRSFDRTGQLSVVISPGVGVFEVDLDLTNITKQRIIDNGIGSDLVCLGEQPLHAVPLFKFNAHINSSLSSNFYDIQYNMPHWINLSFYSSTIINHSGFIPRIKFPNVVSKTDKENKERRSSRHHSELYRSPSRDSTKSCRNIPSLIDYDEYDAQIFKVTPSTVDARNSTYQPSIRRKTSQISYHVPSQHMYFENQSKMSESVIRRSSEAPVSGDSRNESPTLSVESSDTQLMPLNYRLNPRINASQLSTSMENRTFRDARAFSGSFIKQKPESKDDLIVRRYSTSVSVRSPLKPKALINPFDPSHVTIKLTSNRRRWTHVFPLGNTGIFMQQHHYQAVPQNTACTLLPSAACADASFTSPAGEVKDQTDIVPHRKISVVHMKSENLWVNNERKSKSIVANQTPDILKVKSPFSRVNSTIISNDLIKNVSVHSDKSLLWAWGATGEQEWTPAITTGVDWKSLVMPACLPITTDFLPDKRTLQQDYVTYAYTLLPEDQSADLLQQRCYRGEDDSKNHAPLTNYQVFLELVCQRLQQGFQIILLPKNESHQKMSGVNIHALTNENHEYVLSIGRIFHEVKSDGPSITITNYHPRHPYPVMKIHYGYRFRAPDNDTYGVNLVDFTSEKLENYKWNYLDNYICMRGDNEYELSEIFKYWRVRLLMLPSVQSAIKIITDNYSSGEDPDFPCDIYNDFTITYKLQLQEGFLRFLDIINRVPRRQIPVRKSNAKSEKVDISNNNRRFSIGQSLKLTQTEDNIKSENNKFRDRISSIPIHDRPRPRPAANAHLAVYDKGFDHADGSGLSTVKDIERDESIDSNEDISEPSKKLNLKSSPYLILEEMKIANTINFVRQNGLPPNTFISAEAVEWAKENIEEVDSVVDALPLFQSLCDSGLICHASSNADLDMFEKEWMEVGVVPQTHNNSDWYESNEEVTLTKGISMDDEDFTFKRTFIDLDDGTKCGRVEWISLKYHSIYDPEQAFEMEIEWMVATGNAIAEIIYMWNRKATNTGLHLVPIPTDPFALPNSSKSDPLRGPIFIPLNVQSLPEHAIKMLKDEGLFNFQERILVKFGFIPFHDSSVDTQRQFVHVSGSIFLMIPSKKPLSMKNYRKRGKLLKVAQSDTRMHTPHEDYITRHFSGVKQTGESTPSSSSKYTIGYLWCWNYMITKRWKTSVTGEEILMRKIMSDFRAFCLNANHRLTHFWENYRVSPMS